MINKIILFLFSICTLFSIDEFEISLETQNSLSPIYISKVLDDKSSFDSSYLNKLKQVFDFDFKMCAFTNIVKNESNKDLKISHFNFETCFDNSFWEKQKLFLVIKSEVNKKKLKSYVYNVSKNYLKIFETDLDGNLEIDRKKLHKLTDEIIEFFFQKTSINGLKVIYTVRSENDSSNKLKWKSEIWMCDADGNNKKALTNDKNYFVHPLFIPNSNEYIYVSYISGQPKIFKASLDSSDRSEIVSLRGNQLLPAITQNFDKLAFISDAAGRPDIFLQNFDANKRAMGKPIQIFSYPRATQASPCFSPDGSKIAFVSDKDGTPRIYSLNLNDVLNSKQRGFARLITKKNRENVTPCWSKDGKKLAYSAKTDGVRQIWIFDFEEKEEMQLTKEKFNKENPIWAKDSLHIVYNTEDNNESEIYIIDINKKNPIKISSGEGRKRFPSFEP